MRWFSPLGACLALFCAILPAHADDISPTQYTAAANMLSDMADGPALLEICPADIYQTRMTLRFSILGWSTHPDRSDCAADFLNCVQSCIDTGDARACLHAAVLLERSGDPTLKLSARIGHAMACAGGDPSGCTNRGGGIRNVPLLGDDLSMVPYDDKLGCLFRTFKSSCADDDSWGCAMSAQTYAYGEGVGADTARALTTYALACTLASNETDPSCAFATRGINALQN
jgi:hypothetical protein